jgi:hypothetical protein
MSDNAKTDRKMSENEHYRILRYRHNDTTKHPVVLIELRGVLFVLIQILDRPMWQDIAAVAYR